MVRLLALLPARLYLRLVLLLSLLLVVGAIVSAWITQSRLATRNLDALAHETQGLAHEAADAAGRHRGNLDAVRADPRLRQLARLPEVRSIALVDGDGRALLLWTGSNEPGLDPAPRLGFAVPTSIPGQGRNTIEWPSANEALAAWAPLDGTGGARWIRVEHSLAGAHATERDAWISAVASQLALAALMVALLAAYLRFALRPLEDAARFAHQLANAPGATFEADGSSREIRALAAALSGASTRLREQYDALLKRDTELATLLDTAADAVVGVDEHGKVLLFNAAATSIFGLSPEQAQGRPLFALVPELTNARLAELIGNGIQIGSRGMRLARLQASGVRNGGTEFPVEVAIGSVGTSTAGGSLRYALMVRDITDLRLFEDALRIYMRALENSNSGIVISDARLPGVPIMYVNAAFSEITGYAAHEVIGRSCSFLQGKERDQVAVDELRRAISEGRATSVTLRNFRRDGTAFWNQLAMAPVRDENGQLTHFVGAVNDITERVEAELASERRSEQLDLILQLSPDGFVLFDGEDKLVYANHAFRRMTGLTASQLAPATTPAQLESQLRALADPKQAWTPLWRSGAEPHDVVLIQPERRILLTQVAHSADGGDRVLFVRDVTRATEVDRMKSEFLSTAAHELRTPMVSIYGFAELLLNRNYPPERSRPMVETIHRQSALIINLVNELLDLARIEARQGKDFHVSVQPLAPIVREAVGGLMLPDDPRRPDVEIESEDTAVAVDADKLRQALANVLSNAYKYSPRDTPISVRTRRRHATDGDEIGIEVRDRGIGMSPEQSARAFERFYRADPSGNIPGTGLGLCIVKEVVELLGGRVDLDSRLGQGTTVTLWLPVAAVASAPSPAAAVAADA